MIVKIEFNLPEQQQEYNICMNGFNYLCALQDTFNIFRNKLKYDECTEEEGRIYNEIWDKFMDILKDQKVNIFEP